MYHVVPQKLMLTDFKTPKKFKTLQGQEIKVDGLMYHINKKVKVNDAKTVMTDVKATNGVIHAIDSVLMPKQTRVVVPVDSWSTLNNSFSFFIFYSFSNREGLCCG